MVFEPAAATLTSAAESLRIFLLFRLSQTPVRNLWNLGKYSEKRPVLSPISHAARAIVFAVQPEGDRLIAMERV